MPRRKQEKEYIASFINGIFYIRKEDYDKCKIIYFISKKGVVKAVIKRLMPTHSFNGHTGEAVYHYDEIFKE